VVAYITPVLIGGGGKPALAGPGGPNIADAKRFQLEDDDWASPAGRARFARNLRKPRTSDLGQPVGRLLRCRSVLG
jgi:hypothetical protein